MTNPAYLLGLQKQDTHPHTSLQDAGCITETILYDTSGNTY
jgi:hypothetical protein